MIVEKKEIEELQKIVSRKLAELQLAANPDSAEIFDLSMLDSNISLFLLAAEFQDDPIELKSSDKLIIDALKKYRGDFPREADPEAFTDEAYVAASEIIDLIDQFQERLDTHPERIYAANIKARFDVARVALKQVAALKRETKKNLKLWKSQEVPLPFAASPKSTKAKSEKRAEASRRNGQKGGRPRKTAPVQDAAPSATAVPQPADDVTAAQKA